MRTIVFAVAAFAIPVGGAFTIRDGLAWLPEVLWVAALPAVFAGGMRWSLAGAMVMSAVGGLLIFLVNVSATGLFRVTPLVLDVRWLIGAWAGAATICGLLGAWLATRWRSGARLQELTDPLTGLPNRRRAELFLEHEFAVAQLGRPLAVLLLDVDGFAAYAAVHGEAASNGVLRSIGTILRQNTRSANLSVHWGDDRFACLLNGSGEEGAFAYARLIQDCIRAGSDVATVPSVSIGIATFERSMAGPADLVRAAEEALQQAKRDGGNRIRFHGRSLDDPQPAGPRRPGVRADPGRRDTMVRAPESMGTARSAFVFSGDPAVRHRVADLLERRGVHVTEGSRAREAMRLLGREFDLVVVELTRDDPGVRDLVSEARSRHPATRVVGIPAFDGETIRTSASAVHVDAHLLDAGGRWLFQPSLEDLLHERDRLRATTLRALQLSDEVRAKEREAWTARQEGEARLRSVVQSINEVLFRVDRSGAWIALSPAWTAITGMSVDTSLGRPWIENFHADDRDALRAEMEGLSAIERPVVRREARILTRSGAIRWVEVRAQLTHDRFGNMQSAAGTLTDITERRRAEDALRRNEEYFRVLIENAADVIIVLDGDGRVRYTSPSVERVLGYDDDERMLPGLETICHPDDAPSLVAALESAGSPGASASHDMRARHSDGSWRDLAVTIRNLSHIPAVRGLVINAHDVTAHRQAERALRESEEALFNARKMDAIGMLAGGVANDFNNLLTAIQGHADMARSSLAADHPIRAELDHIRDAAARAATVTRQLLAFGRRQVLRPRSVRLNDFISELGRMVTRILGEPIRLETALDAEPDDVRIDPIQIERVLLNLAVNARDAMPDGGVLSIRTRRECVTGDDAGSNEVEPGDYVVLSISDTGHGIPEEIRPHVFDPFFTTKPQAVGVGLGLSTVYGIVRQSGGHIRMESRRPEEEPGDASGTTFTIYLPCASRTPGSSESGPIRARRAGGETIALVEDERPVRELAARILRQRGYTVISAENGAEAMETLGRYPHRIDLLLTDVVLPGMNGRDLADRIGTMRPGIRVLFMSGFSPEAVHGHGVLTRGSTFIEKPFSPDALARRVREVLDATHEDPAADLSEAGDSEAGIEVVAQHS